VPSQCTGGELWSDPATWGGAVPGDGAIVQIASGRTILLDQDTADLGGLDIAGTLQFCRQDLALTSKYITVHHGRLEIGTEKDPFTQSAVITLTGTDQDPHQFLHGIDVGTKGLVVMVGQLDLHGAPRIGWVQLGATAQPGATELTVSQAVDWQAGDRIILASSDLNPAEAETLTVTKVAGKTVDFAEPLQYRHWGDLLTYADQTVDRRAEVGLLSHNVRIQSADDAGTAAGFGGHTMIMTGSLARISGVEFYRMGQFNNLGRYPLHWHLAGDQSGSYAIGNSIHDSLQRGLVVHGTDNVLVQGNVVANTIGHSYMTENSTETGNVFDGNLGLGTVAADIPNLRDADGSQNDDRAATFWIRGAGNTFTHNVAAGSTNNGFWFDRSAGVPKLFQGNIVHSVFQINFLGDDAGISVNEGSLSDAGVLFENLTIYATYRGLWLDADTSVTGSILADNYIASGYSIDLRDSLVIGRTAAADPGPAVGLADYDGLVQARRVTWVNFNTDTVNGVIMRTLGPGPHESHFIVEGSRFINTSPLPFLQRGDVVFEDVDGSHFGEGYRVMVTDRSLATPDCEDRQDDLGGWLCPTLQPYQLLHYANLAGLVQTIFRDDGIPILGDGTGTTIARREYTVDRDLEELQTLLVWGAPYAGGDETDWVRLAVPVASDQFHILGPNDETYQPVGSLQELSKSDERVYFYDADAGKLYLKVVSDSLDENGGIRIISDSYGPHAGSGGGRNVWRGAWSVERSDTVWLNYIGARQAEGTPRAPRPMPHDPQTGPLAATIQRDISSGWVISHWSSVIRDPMGGPVLAQDPAFLDFRMTNEL
jgi:hypothetical protein